MKIKELIPELESYNKPDNSVVFRVDGHDISDFNIKIKDDKLIINLSVKDMIMIDPNKYGLTPIVEDFEL